MVYSSRQYQQSPDFKWSDLATTTVFFFLLLIEIHLFLRIWDFLGVPVDYIEDSLNATGTQTQGSGGFCLAQEQTYDFQCCNDLATIKGVTEIQKNIQGIIKLVVVSIVIGTKLLAFFGSVVAIFLWGWSRFNHAKTAYMSGGGNIGFLIIQALFAGIVVIICLSLLYYAIKNLLFFDVVGAIAKSIQCAFSVQ